MTDEKAAEGRHQWKSNSAPAWRWQRPETPVMRFLGGTPADVALRLFFLSLVVGALLMWLDIKPADIIEGFLHFVHRIWAMGFGAIRELGNYLVAGAVVVVPIWFVLRLFNVRGPR